MVKIGRDKTSRQSNRLEWQAWQKLKDTVDSRLVAPCVDIEDDARWLIQVRAERTDEGFTKETAPFWMGDYGAKNCGVLNGNLVQVDYGCTFTAAKLGIDMEALK